MSVKRNYKFDRDHSFQREWFKLYLRKKIRTPGMKTPKSL